MNRDSKRHPILSVILITLAVLLYFILYFGLLINYLPNWWLKGLCAVIGVLLIIMMIKVCRERLNEIKGGETDDLSNY